MGNPIEDHAELAKGLRALAESAFPKKCANCGRTFTTAEQFLLETEDIRPETSGLKQSEDDDGQSIVEAFRNCPCGSTLMDFFSDRRDLSEAGLRRREKFRELQEYLVSQGVDAAVAREELLKVMRGQKSALLAKIRPPDAGQPVTG